MHEDTPQNGYWKARFEASGIAGAFDTRSSPGEPPAATITTGHSASGKARDLLRAAAEASGCPPDALTAEYVRDALRAVAVHGPGDEGPIEDSDDHLRVLPEEATPEELYAWAASHPSRLKLCEGWMIRLVAVQNKGIFSLLLEGHKKERRLAYRAVSEALGPATPKAGDATEPRLGPAHPTPPTPRGRTKGSDAP